MLIDQELVKIKVLGAGGAGGNAINDMISSGVGRSRIYSSKYRCSRP